MQVTTDKTNRFAAELKIVPWWAWTLAALGFLFALVVCIFVAARDINAPPAWARALMGVAAGLVFACYLLLVGYVNRDAQRRGMSPLLWTLLAILIPNGFGILLYFILRSPRRASCPQCGQPVQPDFDFCPACSHRVNTHCPHCHGTLGARVLGANAAYCPYCGSPLTVESAGSPANSVLS